MKRNNNDPVLTSPYHVMVIGSKEWKRWKLFDDVLHGWVEQWKHVSVWLWTNEPPKTRLEAQAQIYTDVYDNWSRHTLSASPMSPPPIMDIMLVFRYKQSAGMTHVLNTVTPVVHQLWVYDDDGYMVTGKRVK
jgi:hypothetical protein